MRITPVIALVLLLARAASAQSPGAHDQAPHDEQQKAPGPAPVSAPAAQRSSRPDPPPAQPGEVIEVTPVDLRTGHVGDLVSPEPAHPDAARALHQSGFVTVIRLGEHDGETLPLAEALSDTVGVAVRSLGGLGGFSSLSVRGAPSGQTAVLIDGVPLARLGSATFDLGRFDLGSFSEVSLRRGAAPGADTLAAPAASTLALETQLGVPAGGHPLRLSIGSGSFGARHLRARWLGGDPGGRAFHLAIGYAGADGDFPYFNDNGTNLNQSDDATVTRQNNGYDQLDAALRGRIHPGGWRLTAGARTLWKRQGVPGSASVQSRTASLSTFSQMGDAEAERPGAFGAAALTAHLGAFGLFELQRYRDLDGEIGVGAQDRRYTTVSTGAAAGVDAALGPHRTHTLSAAAQAGLELYTDTDLMASGGQGSGMTREHGRRWLLSLAVADAIRLGRDPSAGPAARAGGASDAAAGAPARVRIDPSVRLDLVRTRPLADPEDPVADIDLAPRTEVHASPRLAVLVRAAPALSVKADAGRYLRTPTALELYGDRGFLVGNPHLRAETGESADLGLVLAPPHRLLASLDRVYLEATGFTARSRDTLVLVPTAALVTGAQNLGSAWIWGGELTASARAARAVTVTANYTLLGSRQDHTLPSYEGKELPERPRHQLYARADLAGWAPGHRLAVLWGDAALSSGNYLDPANLDRAPARALFGAGVKLELWPGLMVAVEGKNLTDQRVESVALEPPPRPDLTSAPRAVSDFFGYPLPGRAFYLTLQWEP